MRSAVILPGFYYVQYFNSLCICFYREIRNVELLKLRFGESHMHYCEVMLKVCFAIFSTLVHIFTPLSYQSSCYHDM